MDAAVPKLGSGIKSANCSVWRTDYQLSIKRKARNGSHLKHAVSDSIPSAFVLLPEKHASIPEAGCGQRPQNTQLIQCLIKNIKKMYRLLSKGYTIDRKMNSTAANS